MFGIEMPTVTLPGFLNLTIIWLKVVLLYNEGFFLCTIVSHTNADRIVLNVLKNNKKLLETKELLIKFFKQLVTFGLLVSIILAQLSVTERLSKLR